MLKQVLSLTHDINDDLDWVRVEDKVSLERKKYDTRYRKS